MSNKVNYIFFCVATLCNLMWKVKYLKKHKQDLELILIQSLCQCQGMNMNKKCCG